jgi:hypothetical protein
MHKLDNFQANWPAPAHVKAFTTTRLGGFSAGAYESLNFGDHVGDDDEAVRRNRKLLRETFNIPEPSWLKQVHGIDVVEAEFGLTGAVADGSYTEMVGTVCAVLTADCLPVFLCDRQGTKVAVLHAGWRGLAAGVIESGVLAMRLPGSAPASGRSPMKWVTTCVTFSSRTMPRQPRRFGPTGPAGGRWTCMRSPASACKA